MDLILSWLHDDLVHVLGYGGHGTHSAKSLDIWYYSCSSVNGIFWWLQLQLPHMSDNTFSYSAVYALANYGHSCIALLDFLLTVTKFYNYGCVQKNNSCNLTASILQIAPGI